MDFRLPDDGFRWKVFWYQHARLCSAGRARAIDSPDSPLSLVSGDAGECPKRARTCGCYSDYALSPPAGLRPNGLVSSKCNNSSEIFHRFSCAICSKCPGARQMQGGHCRPGIVVSAE